MVDENIFCMFDFFSTILSPLLNTSSLRYLCTFLHCGWALRGDVTLPCFAGDPFHSSSEFDLDLADDGGKNVVRCFQLSSLVEGKVKLHRIISIAHLNSYETGIWDEVVAARSSRDFRIMQEFSHHFLSPSKPSFDSMLHKLKCWWMNCEKEVTAS